MRTALFSQIGSRARAVVALLLLLCATMALAQHDASGIVSFTGVVTDAEDHSPLPGAVVSVTGRRTHSAISDANGRYKVNVPRDESKQWQMRITYVGYKSYTVSLTGAKTSVNVAMRPSAELAEVVVTAQESNGLAAASVIEKHAMEHLQPSSFADILELLPGGRANDPELDSPNNIRIRETGTASSYTTSSLGVSFLIDGAPISTNANMEQIPGAWETSTTSRNNVNSGVDMRSISTDDIEKVEVVRGIASVEYGDLTSGLVKVERRKGGHDWGARLKADMGSKLFYLTKGLEWKPQRLTLNLSADYLDAKADPRNRLENYKRLTFSARMNKAWETERHRVTLGVNLDYTGSFDNDKQDPDLNSQAEDSYESGYNRIALLVKSGWAPKAARWFKALDATLSAAYESNTIDRTKLVQLSRQTAVATTTATGESDGVILPYTYVAQHKVEGRPLNVFAKVNAKFQVPSNTVSNTLLVGTDWTMDKNYGRGQVYDMTRPLYSTSSSIRPRDLSAIPANHQWAVYAEEHVTLPLGRHRVEAVAGLRGTQMLNLPSSYAMHGRFYWDPRANLGWTLPQFTVMGQPTFIKFAGGIGKHTKMPTMTHLYPDMVYLDLVQLNYYHENADYRRVNMMTYAINPANYELEPAHNLKWEVSTDINIGGNRLSVTFFRENMTSGFRTQSFYAPYTYKWYDYSGLDANTLTGQPELSDLPYEMRKELRGYSYYTNGSQTLKRGIEYTLSTKRIESIHTRLTINGAWFRTTYRNSQVETYRPSAVISGKQIQYVGYYAHDGGSENEMLNTNFTFDTDIPKLRLGFSLSAQCLWYTMTQTKETDNYPTSYMDNDGVMHAWQEGDENDLYLRYLVRSYSASNFAKYRVPFSMNLNLKVTKKLFADRLLLALFCNKLLDYNPEYDRNGMTIRRHVTPYFGLEMNVKI